MLLSVRTSDKANLDSNFRRTQSASFFSLPISTKAALAWEDPRSNRGFVQQGRERVTQATDAAEIAQMREKAPDCKETMEIGRDWDKTWRNMWPKEEDCPGFKGTMLDFFKVRPFTTMICY